MTWDVGVRAVIYINTWVERLKAECFRFARLNVGRPGASAGPIDRMEVNIVHMEARRIVFERELYRVAFAGAQERTGHRAVERPVIDGDAGRNISNDFLRCKFHFYRLWLRPIDGWREIGRILRYVLYSLERIEVSKEFENIFERKHRTLAWTEGSRTKRIL